MESIRIGWDRKRIELESKESNMESTRIEVFWNRNRKDRNRIGFRFLLSCQSISHRLSFFVVIEIQVNVGRSRKMFPTRPSIRWTSTCFNYSIETGITIDLFL